jgi:hypothetical protein
VAYCPGNLWPDDYASDVGKIRIADNTVVCQADVV